MIIWEVLWVFFLALFSVRSITASLFLAFITSHPHWLPLTLFICYPLCLFFWARFLFPNCCSDSLLFSFPLSLSALLLSPVQQPAVLSLTFPGPLAPPPQLRNLLSHYPLAPRRVQGSHRGLLSEKPIGSHCTAPRSPFPSLCQVSVFVTSFALRLPLALLSAKSRTPIQCNTR